MANKDERPIAIRKFIDLFNQVYHFDENSNEPFFFKTLVKMDNSADIHSFQKKRCKDVMDLMDQLVARFADENSKYFEALEKSRAMQNKKRGESFLVVANSEFYSNLGDNLVEFGILDSLVLRSNKAFSNVGAPFLCINKEMAKEEFNRLRNTRTSDPVLSMKIVFYINKIVKYIDDIEFGEMLERDENHSKIKGHRNLKYISKLKTDYLRKIAEADKSVGLESCDMSVFADKNEYKRLFGEFFSDLNLDEDLAVVKYFETEKDIFYISKGGILNNLFLNLAITPNGKNMDRDLTAWGITKDDNDHYVFGMNLFSYPMPLTVHFQRDVLERSLKVLKATRGDAFRMIIPRYESLYTTNGNIFTTNILFATNDLQRKRIKDAYESNPNNECIRFFYNQIKGRTIQNRNEGYHINDLLL